MQPFPLLGVNPMTPKINKSDSWQFRILQTTKDCIIAAWVSPNYKTTKVVLSPLPPKTMIGVCDS